MNTGGEYQTPEEKNAALLQMLQETDAEIARIKGEIAEEANHHNARKERIAILKARRVVILQAYQQTSGSWYHRVQVNHDI